VAQAARPEGHTTLAGSASSLRVVLASHVGAKLVPHTIRLLALARNLGCDNADGSGRIYFRGKDRTKVRAEFINLRRSTSSPKAPGPARTQPCIRRLRDIIGTIPGTFSAQPSLSLPSLISIPSSRAPHKRLPYSNQAHPPNIPFSINPGSDLSSSLTNSSRPASRATSLTRAATGPTRWRTGWLHGTSPALTAGARWCGEHRQKKSTAKCYNSGC